MREDREESSDPTGNITPPEKPHTGGKVEKPQEQSPRIINPRNLFPEKLEEPTIRSNLTGRLARPTTGNRNTGGNNGAQTEMEIDDRTKRGREGVGGGEEEEGEQGNKKNSLGEKAETEPSAEKKNG